MTSFATLTVSFSSAMLLMHGLVSSYCTRLERANKPAAFLRRSSECPDMGCHDLLSHLVSDSLS